MTTIIILFALAAVFGLIVIANVLKEKTTPKPAVFIHGLLAAAALVLLIIYVVNNPDNAPMISLILFVVAALGGFVLFGVDMSKKQPPKPLALIHAGAAIVGFILLLFFAYG